MAGCLPDQVSPERPAAAYAGSPAKDATGEARGRPLGDWKSNGASPPRSEPIPAELARRRDSDLFRLTAPVLNEFAPELAHSGHVLSFFDAGGWMLWIGGCPRNAERLAQIGFRPGVRCHDPSAHASGPAAAARDRSALEVVPDGAPTCAEGWSTSIAAITGTCSPAPAAFVKVATPVRPREARDIVTARAIAHVIEERLHSAVTIREQVTECALRAAAGAQEAVFAVDTGGWLIGANEAARRRLAFDGLDAPAAVREALAALVAAPVGSEGVVDTSDRDLEIDWPGGTGRVKLHASLIRYREQVLGAMVRAIAEARPRRVSRGPQGPAALARYGFDQILGESGPLRAAIALARTAARNDLPVVLFGESGTGKELFAQAIHSASARRAGALIAVNCGCIPASILEAELFGYEAGTFTGGRSEGNVGKFEKADGGTILLDEITELSPQGQAALLRVLQEREVVRLGSSTPRRVDVRVIAASNKSLPEEIAAGRFRADLYFRLNVLSISVPPLRERREDVKLLTGAFLHEAEAQVRRSGLVLSPAAIAALEAYRWPGNVRELRNVILRTAVTAAGTVIEERDLPDEVRSGHGEAQSAVAANRGEQPDEREALLRALTSTSSWNVALAANALHVSRTTLYRWMRKHHIER